MLLAFDIGNSHITMGAYQGEERKLVARMVTDTSRTDDQYAIELHDLLHLYGIEDRPIDGAIICSVVPELCAPMKSAVYKLTGAEPLIVGPGVKTGLNILIDNPAQLGADLVAGAVAAIAKYPLPCAVFDMGTATTISVIDRHGNFTGCMISPGVGIALRALTEHTALLPHVSMEWPPSLIGKNTVQSMQSGMLNGTVAMMDGMASRMEKELGQPVTLVATGGYAHLTAPFCEHPFILADYLLLDGLRMIYEKNHKP